MSKIQMLQGTTTPEVFLAKLMEASDRIENVACVIKYKNGDTAVLNTSMPNTDVCWMRWVFDQEFRPKVEP